MVLCVGVVAIRIWAFCVHLHTCPSDLPVARALSSFLFLEHFACGSHSLAATLVTAFLSLWLWGLVVFLGVTAQVVDPARWCMESLVAVGISSAGFVSLSPPADLSYGLWEYWYGQGNCDFTSIVCCTECHVCGFTAIAYCTGYHVVYGPQVWWSMGHVFTAYT